MSHYTKNKNLFTYGLASALLIIALRWIKFKFLILNHSYEIYITIIALLFTFFGIWIAKKISTAKIKTIIVEKEIYISNKDFKRDEEQVQKYNLSSRELEVLELMAKGMSNQEIANELFVSLHTIKSHSSNIFEKLNVNRRTQAIEIAKKTSLIP